MKRIVNTHERWEKVLHIKIRKQLLQFSLDIELDCRPGMICSIVGPSGAGKTTLLRCIAGFMEPNCGMILLGKKILFSSKTGINISIQNRRVGLMTQQPRLFPHMTILENISFAWAGGMKPMELLEESEIAHLSNKKPHNISGGEHQRAALCRVLAMQPDILLLDEPFSSLDLENKHRLQLMVRKLTNEHLIPVIYVTHDLSSVISYSDQCKAIKNGKDDPLWLSRQMMFLNKSNSGVPDYIKINGE